MKKQQASRSRSLIIRGAFVSTLLSIGGITLILTSTRPETIGLLGVVGFFLLVYLVTLSFFILLYALRQRQNPLRFRSAMQVAVLALAPVMLLALSSTDRLGPLDILLVTSFEIAAIFYVGRVA